MLRLRLPIVLGLIALVAPSSFLAQSIPPPPPRHVIFSSYLGGAASSEGLSDVAVGDEGRSYVVGSSCADLPTTPDALRRSHVGCDGYLAILSATGSLLYGTYIGGSEVDRIGHVALDAAGNIYLLGSTWSPDFPTTAAAFDRLCGSDGTCQDQGFPNADLFVMKLAPLGRSVVWSTYLGGRGLEHPSAGIAVDASGRVHVAAGTDSADFPTTRGALSGASRNGGFDGIYTRLSADGSRVDYSTYLSSTEIESVGGIAVDATGAAYIAGYTFGRDFPTVNAMTPSSPGATDGWLVKVDAAGSVAFSTYIGGSWGDTVTDVAVDATSVYLAGDTFSDTWPEPPGAERSRSFVIKLPHAGTHMTRAITMRRLDTPRLEVDAHQRIYVMGTSRISYPFTATPDAAQPFIAGDDDAAIGIFNTADDASDAPVYASHFGSPGPERPSNFALAPDGTVVVVGFTSSGSFPIVNAIDPDYVEDGTSDAFVVRLATHGLPRNDLPGEVVLHASDVDRIVGKWELVRDVSAAGGSRLSNFDSSAAKINAPLAQPADYVEFSFTADAGVYRLWLRGLAYANHWANDSVYVQFSDSVDQAGQPTWRIGSTSGTVVNLEDAANAGLNLWGWQDNGYGAGVLGPLVRLTTGGTHTIRIQVREDGFAFDQIVLSKARFLNAAPGALQRDDTVLAPSNSGGEAPPPPPPPPPSSCDPKEIVVHPGVSGRVNGTWRIESDASAASGKRVSNPDAGALKVTTPLAAPANYVEVDIDVEANVSYWLWIRGKAHNDHWANDSVYVQFTASLNRFDSPAWRIGSNSGLPVNIEDCSGCGLSGWGWQDDLYGQDDLTPVRFGVAGRQILRIQTREDGLAIDQIVLSQQKYAGTRAPGSLKNDTTLLPACESAPPPPPLPPSDGSEVVLYPVSDATIGGRWTRVADTSATGGHVLYPDRGDAKVTAPLASTTEAIEMQFHAQAGIPYRVWIRGRAQNDYWANDSIWVQFSGSVNASGTPVFRTGTTSGTSINLEECSGCGLKGWGWQDNGYGAPQLLGEAVYFAESGPQKIRIQPREDGLAIDQVVISAAKYLNAPPGAAKNDTTVVAK